MYKRIAALSAALIVCALLPRIAAAHPEELGQAYVPWTDKLSKQQRLGAETSTAAARAGSTAVAPAPAA